MDAPLGIEELHEAGGRMLRLSGALTVGNAKELDRRLAQEVRLEGPLTLDIADIERMDTVGAWVVHKLLRDKEDTRLAGAGEEEERLLAEVAAADRPCAVRPAEGPLWRRELEDLGRYMAETWRTMTLSLAFLGLTIASLWRTIAARRPIRWGAVSVQMEQAGVNALGIVGLMSFLIGIVIAQQGYVQLRQFGAEVFVINLVGRATFRELGVLLTAIMVAGRSASAFAAQLGTMKLTEEVDAMRTLGLDPVEVLVLPRTIALVLMMPLLGFYASILAIAGGGLFTWLVMDIPPVVFVQRINEVVPMSDFWMGMIKAPVFGAIIATIGCFQGLQVTGTAESVGQRTTIAVVQAIFLVIVLDAFFAVFFTAVGWD
jgi:phospholipid/cholesterol/gamma-HCH transport system permease protein